MAIQDKTVVRSAADLEKKYNFAKLLGLTKNVESNEKSLIKVENELNNMLNSLIINLGDVLDSQSDISLWFYEGIPSKNNVPYIEWNNPSEHIGDLYYDQNSGYVYKYLSEGWIQQDDINLKNALALTNSDIDTQTDHERKVYFSQPTPPYSSGDWWILEDGTLKICQLGKDSTGEYELNDFVVSSQYTTVVATKQGDDIVVLKGTLTEITENYVKYTDLSTGGSTTIAGENITTGSIKSSNYVSNVSGTKINLVDGTVDTKNVKIDNDGLKLSNGAKVVGNNGLKNTYLYEVKNALCGFSYGYNGTDETNHEKAIIKCIIPEGLEITKAKVIFFHTPISWEGNTDFWGWLRNCKLYKTNNLYSQKLQYGTYSQNLSIDNDYPGSSSNPPDVINTTFYNSNGVSVGNSVTPTTPSSSFYNTEKFYTSDFSSVFKNSNGNTVSGLYNIYLTTSDSKNGLTEDESFKRCGLVSAVLEIEGYMTYE